MRARPRVPKRLNFDRPPAEDEYARWLTMRFGRTPGVREGSAYYDTVVDSLKRQVESSAFWQSLQGRMPDIEAEYLISTGMQLSARPHSGYVVTKPWTSFTSKAYRINVRENQEFP